MSKGLQEQDEALIEVSTGREGGNDKEGVEIGEFAEDSLQSMKSSHSVVVNLDVNAGFLRLRFGEMSATNHRPSRISLAHTRL